MCLFVMVSSLEGFYHKPSQRLDTYLRHGKWLKDVQLNLYNFISF